MVAAELAERAQIIADAGGHAIIVHTPEGGAYEVYSAELRGQDCVLNTGAQLNQVSDE